jgi:hypothetical protein
LIFRNRQGQSLDREAAEAMLQADGIEVASDVFEFDRQQVMIRSRLQPVCNVGSEPLFLTMVFGDKERGLQELPSHSEDECRELHRALVDRYLLVERERHAGTPRPLLNGAL